jgi:hypothetical protein
MPLNLNNGGYTPHIRYMAGTSSWMISTENGTQTINMPPCVYDLANIQTGWGYFAENSAPEWSWDKSLEAMSQKPNDGKDWKRGFGLNILLPQEYGPERLREFATTGIGAVEGIKELYAQYEQQAPSYPGKVPVVEYRGARPEVFGKGRTNIPTLVIVNWIDRPAALDEDVGKSAPPQSHAAPQAEQQTAYQPASNPVTPPSNAPASGDGGNLSKPVF